MSDKLSDQERLARRAARKAERDALRASTVVRTLKLPICFPRPAGKHDAVKDDKGKFHPCECAACQDWRKRKRELHNAIVRYRQALRTGAAKYMVLTEAGATLKENMEGWVNVVPGPRVPVLDEHGQPVVDREGKPMTISKAKAIMDILHDDHHAQELYAMRPLLAEMLKPLSSSFADQVMRDIVTVWKSGDPVHPQMSRAYRFLNDCRRFPAFTHIGLSLRAKNVVLGHNDNGTGRGHWVTLTLARGTKGQSEKEQAEFVCKMKIKAQGGKLDASRWVTLRNIQSGLWPMGDPIRLDEEDGKFCLFVPYRKPITPADVDPNRVLEVAFDADRSAMIQFHMRQGAETLRDELRSANISAEAAIAAVDRIAKQSEICEMRVRAAIRRNEKRVAVSEQQRRDRITKQRTHVEQDWNHRWTKRVIEVAVTWRCGVIELHDLPTNIRVKDDEEASETKGGLKQMIANAAAVRLVGLFERPWGWADFRNKLASKAQECRIKFVVPGEEKDQKQQAVAANTEGLTAIG